MEAEHVFSAGNARAFAQGHKLDNGVYRVTFWLDGHEPPVKGYTMTRKNAEAARNAFLLPPEEEQLSVTGRPIMVRPAPSETSLATAANMLEPAEAFGL